MPDPTAAGRSFRAVAGGILVQERDRVSVGRDGLRTVTRRAPSETEIADLRFADIVAKYVKSNAIVFAHGGAPGGIRARQTNPLHSASTAAPAAAPAGAMTPRAKVRSATGRRALGPLPWTAEAMAGANPGRAKPICVPMAIPERRTRVSNISPYRDGRIPFDAL